MADIKQAAMWLREGKNVRRRSWLNKEYSLYSTGPNFDSRICCQEEEEDADNDDVDLAPSDLDAQDWEVVD